MLLTRKKKVKNSKETKKVLYCASCGYEAPFGEEDKEKYTISMQIDHAKDKTMVLLVKTGNDKISEEEREAHEEFFNPDE